MANLVRIQRKGQVALPRRLRSAVGLSEGDLVEASLQSGRIILTPKLVIDRSRFATADDEYTPKERRIIKARLAKGLKDIREGRVYGPFATHKEMMESLRAHRKQAKSTTGKRVSR